jgi:putative MATE family efflux protein
MGPGGRRFGGRDLTTGPIPKTLLMFALPLLGSNALQSLNASINAVWVGRFLGERALTGASNANIVLFLLLGAVFGVGMASSILIGQAMGARQTSQVKRVVGSTASVFAIASLAMGAIGYLFVGDILRAMHTPADAEVYAIAYLRVIFLALPFMYFFTFVMMTLRGAGDARTPFYFMLLSAGLDILFNPLLIFGLGPFPKMGIAGSATSTLLAQSISLAAMLVYLYRKKHFLWLDRAEWHYLKPDFAIVRSLVTRGFPMGLQMILMSASAVVMISFVNRFGSDTTAAYGAATQLWTYVQMPAIAISASVSSFAAQNVGAKKWDRVAEVTWIGILFNFMMTGGLVVLLYLFGYIVLGMFLPPGSAAIPIAVHIDHIVIWSFVLFGITMVFTGVVRSTGAVYPPLAILFIAFWVVRIPAATALVPHFGVEAIWWSFPMGTFTSVTLAGLYYVFGNWREAKMMHTPFAPAADTGLAAPVEDTEEEIEAEAAS